MKYSFDDYYTISYDYMFRYLISPKLVLSYQILTGENLNPTELKVKLEITDLQNNKYFLECKYNLATGNFEQL